MAKDQIRIELKEINARIPDKEFKSGEIHAKLLNFKLFLNCKIPLLFYGKKSEVDTRPLIEHCLQTERKVFLPFVDELAIGEVNSLKELKEDKSGIFVPAHIAGKEDYQSIDLIIVPGVGFDRKGNRVGHGLGWYDKLFPIIPESVPRLALSFADLVLTSVPADKHDEPVDFIITEHEIINTHARGNQFETRYL